MVAKKAALMAVLMVEERVVRMVVKRVARLVNCLVQSKVV